VRANSRVRSSAEIHFRLQQEVFNFFHFLAPPSLPDRDPVSPRPLWPSGSTVAAKLAGSPFAGQVLALARQIDNGCLPLLGYQLQLPRPIPWRQDLMHGQQTGLHWFRRLPYLNFSQVGDHKVIWELNRHQHLMVLVQAWLFDQDPRWLQSIASQLDSWLVENPYGRGINWTSALEVAFRALSWLWILHWTGEALPKALRRRLLESLHGHGVYLERNLSYYFSPNTHLMGEAVVLYCLGALFPHFPRAAHWESLGAQVTEAEIGNQVRDDGSHFEQSSSYHVYSTDFFLLYAITAQAAGRSLPAGYLSRLRAMGRYLHALLGPGERIPLLGDDDGGRLFYPYGERDTFGRASLAACALFLDEPAWPCGEEAISPGAAWWLGPVAPSGSAGRPSRESRWFPDAGVACLAQGEWQAVVDTRAFGFGGAGHSHAGALSLVLRRGEREVLIDPGTFTYIADLAARDRFRSTAAHNTVGINGLDQATPMGPFRWSDKPSSKVSAIDLAAGTLTASVAYRGFIHTRHIAITAEKVTVIDEVTGPPGEHRLELYWHLPDPVTAIPPWLGLDGAGEVRPWKRSRCLGGAEPSAVVVVSRNGPLPARFVTAIALD